MTDEPLQKLIQVLKSEPLRRSVDVGIEQPQSLDVDATRPYTDQTKIGWCHYTMNFWWGCTRVSTECKRCYIEGIMKRAGIRRPFGGPIRTKNWRAPIKWNERALKNQEKYRVFTCSMSDFFHQGADEWRSEAWRIIRECQSLNWLILTKRADRILTQLPDDWGDGYPNVWLGTTIGHPSMLSRLDVLAEVPARIKFVSAEPLLAPIAFGNRLTEVDWVITGCEQAGRNKRRPMDIDWVRDIDRQCRRAGIPHFFKQYYRSDNRGRPQTDGMLDGECRQAWPA